MEAEITRMLEDGVVRHSTSEWSSPVIMVPKTDGSLRFCIDLRGVNQKTKAVRYPMPHVQALIDTLTPPLGKQCVYTAIDLKSGFWQVNVAESDRHKLAFQAPSGQYEFCVLPMGARGSPAIFQRLMSLVLRPLLATGAGLGTGPNQNDPGHSPDKCAVLFIDDICVFSPDVKSHVRHLRQVFDLLRLANLKMALKKCEFAQPDVQFLGHVVNGATGTITPAPKNVAVIEGYPVLKDVRAIKAFLGLTSYYRHYVMNYGLIALPLYECLGKQGYQWGSRQQAAFEQLKQALCSKPVLRGPDFERPFILATDFCKTAVAACLSQLDDDGREYAVSFASKKLHDTQRNWSSTDGEAFAAVWAIKNYHAYLYGNPFTLVTDNSALTFIMKAKDLTGKLARDEEDDDYEPSDLGETSSEGILEIDGEPPYYPLESRIWSDTSLLTYLEHGSFSPGPEDSWPDYYKECQRVQRKARRYYMKNGALYRRGTKTRPDVRVLKLEERLPALEEVHDLAHQGARTTFNTLRQRYYWDKMDHDVRVHIANCHQCKPTQHVLVKDAPLRPLPIVGLWQRVHCDLAGPYPTTKQGHRYVIMAVDSWSKWPEVGLLPNKKSKTTARWLYEHFISRYGSPEIILTDQGTEWQGEFDKLLRREHIVHRRTSAYTPTTNGQCESCDEVEDGDPTYAHLPALNKGALVYRKRRTKTKLQSEREGPFRFLSYNRKGTLALVEDGRGTSFTVPIHQLFVPRA
ncbi:hypothetical protein GPECTOR_791g12 [Gonium pectorale]|uniref:Integrase catalytic domain-containing protein n=1 Tax=Gonium pectorale TaxID=33097 RepID=A0A150FU35_GONPE|nr:hypothetical protein GPECTOR_791g12 [Gonium pectorale]|eukprot:KXZ41107.1 hypothetical protein GPECTOR_791g12 [Gonium pectorale]